jgi:hypothetical protein
MMTIVLVVWLALSLLFALGLCRAAAVGDGR